MYFPFSDVHISRAFLLAVLASTSIAMFGCGRNERVSTQVVARVNGEEISVHQINGVLARTAGINQGNLAVAKQEILERLIEQQVAINEAVSKKLDRSPEVVTAIENAKREIIAHALIDQIASSQTEPTVAEAKEYFAAHPELFSQRRVFSLQEIVLRKTHNDMTAIAGKVSTAKTIEEIAAWLKEKNIEFTANSSTRAAEQIPLEVLPALHKFKDGQIGLVESKEAFHIFRVAGSKTAPVDEADALPKIKTYLYNLRSADAIKREKVSLRQKAQVEYLGEFSGIGAASKPKAEENAVGASGNSQAPVAKGGVDGLDDVRAAERATMQAETEAHIKARADAKVEAGRHSSDVQKPADTSANINLEKSMKGLQ